MNIKKIRSPNELTPRGRLGFLLKDSVIYGGAAALSKAFSLITFPLIARNFSTSNYGIIDLFGVIASFLGILIIFGQDSAIARLFFEYEDTSQRKKMISQSLAFQLICTGILCPLIWFNADLIYLIGIETENAKELFKLVIIQAPFLVMMNFSNNLLKWTFQRNSFLTLTLGSMASAVTLIVIGIKFLQVDVKGILIIGLLNNAIFSLMGMWLVRKWLIIPREFHHLKELTSFAFPLGVICIVGAFVPIIERWTIAKTLGTEDLGLYASGIRVAMLVGLFVGAFQTAWGPFSLSLYKQEGAINTYNSVLKGFALAMVVFAFLLAAAAYPLLIILATERYVAAIVVVFPLAIGQVIQATSWITEIGIGISKRSYLNLYSYTIYAALTIGGIYFFTTRLGLVGVALGMLFGHIGKAVTATWLSQKAHPMSWHFRLVSLFLACALVYGLSCIWIIQTYGSLVGSIMFGLGFFAFAISGPFILFNPTERKSIWDVVKIKTTNLANRQ